MTVVRLLGLGLVLVPLDHGGAVVGFSEAAEGHSGGHALPGGDVLHRERQAAQVR